MQRILFLLFPLLLWQPLTSYGCGTVRIWHQRYFESLADTDRLEALKFLHCEPVVSQYRGEPQELSLLIQVIDHALGRSQGSSPYADAFRALAVKNYLVFGLYAGSDEVMEHGMLQDRIGRALDASYFPFDREFKERVGPSLGIFKPFDTFPVQGTYGETVEKQLRELSAALRRATTHAISGTLSEDEETLEIKIVGEADQISDVFMPDRLELSGAVSQTLTFSSQCLCEWPGTGPTTAHHVMLEDINFDGYRDLRAFNNAGATGNRWDEFWLYDPQEKAFAYHDELSGLSQVRLAEEGKQITSFFTQGYCARVWYTFEWREGELHMVKRRYTTPNEQTGACEEVAGVYEEGVFVETSRTVYEQ